jgi:hypothetical protein
VEGRGEPGDGLWERVAEVVARGESGWVTVTNAVGFEGRRFYRLTTPRLEAAP